MNSTKKKDKKKTIFLCELKFSMRTTTHHIHNWNRKICEYIFSGVNSIFCYCCCSETGRQTVRHWNWSRSLRLSLTPSSGLCLVLRTLSPKFYGIFRIFFIILLFFRVFSYTTLVAESRMIILLRPNSTLFQLITYHYIAFIHKMVVCRNCHRAIICDA